MRIVNKFSLPSPTDFLADILNNPLSATILWLWAVTALIIGVITQTDAGMPPQAKIQSGFYHSPFMHLMYIMPTYWIVPGVCWIVSIISPFLHWFFGV